MKIDLVELEKLCALQCTQAEIAAFFGVGVTAIEKRRQENKSYTVKLDTGDTVTLPFKDIMERGYLRGRISLRRAQFHSATMGNVTAQIWLGKQILGQRDKYDANVHAEGGATLEELLTLYRAAIKSPPEPADNRHSVVNPQSEEDRDANGARDAEPRGPRTVTKASSRLGRKNRRKSKS